MLSRPRKRSTAVNLIVHKLSLAAPAFNEAEGIVPLVTNWLAYLRQSNLASEFEIVICNDGSKDQTGALMDDLARLNPEFKPVHHKQNQGAAAALTTAIQNTQGDWVLLIDSDGQFPLDNLPGLLAAAAGERTAAVVGVRARKQDSAFTRFGSTVSSWLCNCFHGTHYRDFNCALKLIEGRVVRALHLEAKGLNYSGEVMSKLLERGVHLAEVDVSHAPRAHGVSSAKAVKGARDRFLFVLYIGLRQLLLKTQVLRRPQTVREAA